MSFTLVVITAQDFQCKLGGETERCLISIQMGLVIFFRAHHRKNNPVQWGVSWRRWHCKMEHKIVLDIREIMLHGNAENVKYNQHQGNSTLEGGERQHDIAKRWWLTIIDNSRLTIYWYLCSIIWMASYYKKIYKCCDYSTSLKLVIHTPS